MKNNIYKCISESRCCTVEMNTTWQINYTSIKLKKKNNQVLSGYLSVMMMYALLHKLTPLGDSHNE